jgi:hypothetical protein
LPQDNGRHHCTDSTIGMQALVTSEALLAGDTGDHCKDRRPAAQPTDMGSTERSFIWEREGSRSRIRYRICLFVNDPAQSFEILPRKRRELSSYPEGATARPEIRTIGEI